MAGSYPDVPSRRMALDVDGSIFSIKGGTTPGSPTNVVTVLGPTNRANANNEKFDDHGWRYDTDPGHTSGANMFTWLFPELREFDGVFASAGHIIGSNSLVGMWSSGDTTNTIDGTWNSEFADYPTKTHSASAYRSQIDSAATSNVRAIQVQSSGGSFGQQSLQKFHIYGEIAAGQTPDRLLFVDDTTGLELNLPFDYGDTPRGSSVDQLFKLKNNSGSLSAGSVQLTAQSLYLASSAWYTFSEGGAFQSTLALASSIGAGGSSPTITLRRIIPDAETLGLHAGRVRASTGSWT